MLAFSISEKNKIEKLVFFLFPPVLNSEWVKNFPKRAFKFGASHVLDSAHASWMLHMHWINNSLFASVHGGPAPEFLTARVHLWLENDAVARYRI
jgi:hypothetical protein